MKDLRPIRGKYYIADLIAQGEHEHQDFKFAINDAEKIAHSISAFANADGGRLLIGVKDNGVVAGVRNDEDIYVVEEAALRFCRPAQQVEFTPFRVDGGLIVIRAEIPKAEARPVMCRDKLGVYRAYYRVGDENIPVPDIMLRAWRAREAANPLSLSDVEMSLLRYMGEVEHLLPKEAAVALHISVASAEQSLLNLYSSGIVEFKYIDGHFRFVVV